MRPIETDYRKPHKIPADFYIGFGCSLIPAIRNDNPFVRNIFRYCDNAYIAIRNHMQKKGCPLGKAVVSKDRIYRNYGQRFYDVFVAYIPVRADSLQEDGYKDHILSAISEFKRIIIERGSKVRVVVCNDLQQFISNEDAFELDLKLEKVYRELSAKGIKIIISYGGYVSDRSGRGIKTEYGWVSRI